MRTPGSARNTIVRTRAMVSQSWTYEPAAFPKAPADDRNYPPVG